MQMHACDCDLRMGKPRNCGQQQTCTAPWPFSLKRVHEARCGPIPFHSCASRPFHMLPLGAASRRRLRAKTRPMVPAVEAESSGAEEEAEAESTARGRCGQFVWPCPREYPLDARVRAAQKWLIPADLSKQAVGELFKNVATMLGHGPNLAHIHVFDEPHKRYSPVTGERERHKHVVFKMKNSFAHVRFGQVLAQRGVHGHFSFRLIGYVAYLRYCLKASGKKLAIDLDTEPWSWPPVRPGGLMAMVDEETPQMDARADDANRRGRKRKLLTFSELTDAFVEGRVRTERDAWLLAKDRKLAGDDTLFNTLGGSTCVRSLVARVQQAWHCEHLAVGTLQTQSDFSLQDFRPLAEIDPELPAWAQGGWRSRSLVLTGRGGLGKTEFACGLMHHISPAKAYHFLNTPDRLRDIICGPGEGLVVDETRFAAKDIEDVKAIIDVAKGRDVKCRNRDGFVPKGTPRAFSTNWPWVLFWPQEGGLPEHNGAITRRVLWISVNEDLRRV